MITFIDADGKAHTNIADFFPAKPADWPEDIHEIAARMTAEDNDACSYTVVDTPYGLRIAAHDDDGFICLLD